MENPLVIAKFFASKESKLSSSPEAAIESVISVSLRTHGCENYLVDIEDESSESLYYSTLKKISLKSFTIIPICSRDDLC